MRKRNFLLVFLLLLVFVLPALAQRPGSTTTTRVKYTEWTTPWGVVVATWIGTCGAAEECFVFDFDADGTVAGVVEALRLGGWASGAVEPGHTDRPGALIIRVNRGTPPETAESGKSGG